MRRRDTALDQTTADDGLRPEQDLEQLYNMQARQLQSSLARQTGCQETARELVQDSFARFLSLPWATRAGIRRPDAYLWRISTNLLRDWGRSQSLRRPHGTLIEPAAPDVDPMAALEARDTLRRLETALLKLKPRTREIFLAHRIEGLTYAQIADRTGLSVKGVEKQMAKAIAKVAALLDRP